MRNFVTKRFVQSGFSRCSIPNVVLDSYTEKQAGKVAFTSDSVGFSYGLKSALAGKGVIVNDKAFRNLDSSELQQKGAIIAGFSSGIPIYGRGKGFEGTAGLSKAQFSKLLKQVTTHLSSISNIFVHDGAVGLSNCDAKVRLISDCPSAVLRLSSVFWKTPVRAVSHDSCPLTIYVATSVSPGVGETIGIETRVGSDFIAADVERSSLILCGKSFSDINGTKEALSALCGPIISARGGLLLNARLLVSNDSVVLLFAPEDKIHSCADELVSADAGVVLFSESVAPLFRTGKPNSPNIFKLPAAAVLACADSSGAIPSLSKLTPGQAAYHFLVGYQNGKFLPAYMKSCTSVDALDVAKSLLSKLKDHRIPSYLVNVEGDKTATGKEFLKLIQSALSNSAPLFQSKGRRSLQRTYHSFFSAKYGETPEEFTF